MKHAKFAWIAAIAFTVLAALPFSGRAQDDAAIFDKTTSRLEKGGISFSYTQGAAAVQMVDKMFDSFNVLVPEDTPEAKEIFTAIRGIVDEFGLKTFLGSGASVKKNGDYYRCIDFEYAPEHKGVFWDLVGAPSKGAAPELKLTSPKSAIAVSSKFEPGALYAFIDKKLRATLDEETMAEIDQQISSLASAGIQPDKLLECISGITFYVEAREFKEEDLQGILAGEDPEAKIMELIPKFALVLTTKSDLCWKALENFISQSDEELVKDGKIVPVEGIAIFQAGNYLVATNDEAAIRDRIAGKGSDLTANAEFAKMIALADKDFSGFSWVSEDYFKMVSGLSGVIGQVAGGVTGGAVPATDPTAIFAKDIHSVLSVSKIDAEGLVFTTITSDLQIALLNSGTVAGTISGLLPYIGPFAKAFMDTMNGSDDMDFEQLERQTNAAAALALLKEAKIPEGKCVFFTIAEDGSGAAFAKWNPEEGLETVGETDETEFPYVILASPEAAEKADNPEETVVFYEDPTEFFDGIFVVFGDGSVKFLEGDFEDHAEAMEAAANTFDLSDKAAADLLKKAAALDALYED
ncbi:MAG: hypothetical protein IJT68_11050 [Lentisphaeria bacterium]|nr:hypothetical protein [Lentisphaeria bacterium]